MVRSANPFARHHAMYCPASRPKVGSDSYRIDLASSSIFAATHNSAAARLVLASRPFGGPISRFRPPSFRPVFGETSPNAVDRQHCSFSTHQTEAFRDIATPH
jgi:hypothetical protein